MPTVERSSRLALGTGAMWAAATSPAAINDELRPLVRMTMPAALRGRTLEEFPVGSPAGRSWILLLGLIPIDYDDLCLVEFEPPRRFLERSRTLAFSVWEHERVISSDGPGCLVRDRLAFELKAPLERLPGAEALARAVVGLLFSNRHRRLRRRAG